MQVSDKWIHLIDQCISTPTFSILMNGSPAGFFNSNHGLRQGDSLSPFLFTMATDVLSRLILQKESDGLLKGIKVARNCPLISHLMFAEDLIIFSRAHPSDFEAIQDCFNQFHEWLDLSVNTAKSVVSFSTNIHQPAKVEICNQTGLKLVDPNSKYHGFPLHIKSGNQSPFNTIIDKINSRITGWKAKVLSQAARSTLIRSVLTSIPPYWMSSFQLPKNTCA